ncbi:MAG: trigger factor, partial [Firmicutes bacterium]|nr:trigger factor [Bacillota bacterium]
MSNFEKLDINKYKISFSVDAEKFEEGLNYSFNKNKNYFRIPGFRKGKAPRKIVEATYGKEVLFNDAVDFVLREAYPAAAKESGLDIVSRPEVEIVDASAENGASFTAIVYVKPEVKISDYKGVTFKKKEIEVTDKDVEERLKSEQKKHSRVIEVADRAVQEGDVAVIDFEGFMDGKAFEG